MQFTCGQNITLELIFPEYFEQKAKEQFKKLN